MKQRTQQVVQAIRRKIDGRQFESGQKLPSVRDIATAMGVSPSTVVEAYDRLSAEGLVYARPRSGFYVSIRNKPLVLAQGGSKLGREADPIWAADQLLEAKPGTAMPGSGWLSAEWLPAGLLRKAIRSVQRENDDLFLSYGHTRGSANLRRFISEYLAQQGVEAGPDHILLTESASHARDLICRLLLSPGDRVLVDDPCDAGFRAMFLANKISVSSVPYTPDGPDTGWFEDVLNRSRMRLYMTNSALQNPTGATIAPHAAHKVLTLVTKNDMVIVEDDTLSEFEPDPSPRFAALDGLDRVIRIGSFSMTISGSMRCGYIAARRDWIEALTDLQIATNLGGPGPFIPEVLYRALSDDGYLKHMGALRLRLADSRREVSQRLAALGVTPWVMPRGGPYLWCSLPNSADAAKIARIARTEGIILAPGNLFSPSQGMAAFMRFNVSQMGDPRIYKVLEQALQASSAEPA